MPLKKQGGSSAPTTTEPVVTGVPNPLGENINTTLIGTTLHITNTGLPGFGDPIKTRLDGSILYITNNGVTP